MSVVNVSAGSSRRWSHDQVRALSTAPSMVSVHSSVDVRGGGPAGRTGQSLTTYWPGGARGRRGKSVAATRAGRPRGGLSPAAGAPAEASGDGRHGRRLSPPPR